MRAKDIMTRGVVSVTPDTSITHVARVMLDHSVSGLPVIDDEGRLVGMITEGDLMRRLELWTLCPRPESARDASAEMADFVKKHAWKAADVMSRDVVTSDEEAPVGVIAGLLDEHKIKRVPILRNDNVVGIVSRADLLRALVAAPPENASRSDQAICLSISTRLREDARIHNEHFSIAVVDGIVHLKGNASSETERQAIRVVAETTPGVRGVVDELTTVTS